MSAQVKEYYPFIKNPRDGQVFPNTELFRQPGFVGCFTSDGRTDLDELSGVELARIFPDGVPARVKEENKALVARANDESTTAPQFELQKPAVIQNLERLYAEGAIERSYLLTLAGGVEQEKFEDLKMQVDKVLKEVEANDNAKALEAEAKAKAEAEAEAKAKAEAEAKAEVEVAKEKAKKATSTAKKKATTTEEVTDLMEGFEL